jgi:hypothetical protein
MAFGVLLLTACGSKGNQFNNNDGGVDEDGSTCDPNDPFCDPTVDEGGMEAAPPCVGLKCQQVACGNGSTTTISGKVFAPNGTLPLYNAIVYVPNAALDPIKNGAVCDQCGAAVSGSPVVITLTDSKGHFVLKDVPVGSNIPVVIQVGKWRRKFVMPTINQCVDNPVQDGKFKFPAKVLPNSDDAMPKIGMVTGGCDPLACILAKIGIDTTEFGDKSNGTNHVTFYSGIGGSSPGSPQPATSLWGSLTEMKKHDIVINSCECSENNQEKTTPQLLQQYADQGGRVFGSHYHYTWQRNLIAAWQGTAAWTTFGSTTTPDLVDMSFPKGKALAEWLMAVNASTILGQIPLQVKTYNVSDVVKPTTRWIYASGGPPTTTHYLSFNTPVGQMPDKQCGKVVYAGLHVSSSAGTVDTSFPQGCNMNFSPDEKALVFLLFDLSSCVQDELKDPEPPPLPK